MIDGLRVVGDGLKAGERVIVLGVQSARPGITVKPEEAPIDKFTGSGQKTALPAGIAKQNGQAK
jgi:hypothetical protein